MGSSQRLAAVAAVSHAKHYYNHTQPTTTQNDSNPYTVNIFFVSATLCGVLVAVCAACWRRAPREHKPEEVECHGAGAGVYTVSADCRLSQIQMEPPGPPPAYETVVEDPPAHKDCHMLQEVVIDPCPRCHSPSRCDELPSYEAALMLNDTKL